MSNNKRIAKNTFLLYARMLITLVVSLYTSRVVLEILGVVDFGIYSVVGGIVAMLTFISNSMASASQRFFAFEIGQGNNKKLNQLYNLTVLIYVIFVILLIIISQTFGLYFVKCYLNVPLDRKEVSVWVYQYAVASFVFTMLRIPLNAIIIAYEKMSFYAWISILEAIFKLAVVYFLLYVTYDKLVFYSFLNFVVVVLVTVCYQIYVLRNFYHCNYSFYWNPFDFKRITSFAGWNMFDSIANVAKNQGVNIILNVFFNPVVNAARAIAFQVNVQITSFVGNLQIATAPQMTKYYANNQHDKMVELFINSSKITFFLFFLIALPFYLLAPSILKLWLVNVPESTIIFTRLIIINTLIDCLGGTSNLAIHAIGDVKLYKIVSGMIMFLNLPISYLLVSKGFSASSTFIVSIVLSSVIVIARLLIIQKHISYIFSKYFMSVIIIGLIVFFVGSFFPVLIYQYLSTTLSHSLLLLISCFVSSLCSIFFIGLNKNERLDLLNMLKGKFVK